MIDHRPVLLGMNNPVSSAPEHALYPYPPGCAGWHLLEILNDKVPVTRTQYLRAFVRRNILNSKTWSRAEAGEAVGRVREGLRGRVVVVLGEEPRRLLGLQKLLIHPQVDLDGTTWRQLPHPSGRNRWYNDKECRALASALLAELYLSVDLTQLYS